MADEPSASESFTGENNEFEPELLLLANRAPENALA